MSSISALSPDTVLLTSSLSVDSLEGGIFGFLASVFMSLLMVLVGLFALAVTVSLMALLILLPICMPFLNDVFERRRRVKESRERLSSMTGRFSDLCRVFRHDMGSKGAKLADGLKEYVVWATAHGLEPPHSNELREAIINREKFLATVLHRWVTTDCSLDLLRAATTVRLSPQQLDEHVRGVSPLDAESVYLMAALQEQP